MGMTWKESTGKLCPMVDGKTEKSLRVFFALWPADKERAGLAAWQPALHKLCGGRIIRADTLHNTLVFLGNIEAHRLEALYLAAQEAEGGAFELQFDTACYWKHNHIVFASPGRVPKQLEKLVHRLEHNLAVHGFEFDRRPYKPHVTLLRNAKWSSDPLPEMEKVMWKMRDFVLVQSAPDEKGTNYRVLAQFPLRHS